MGGFMSLLRASIHAGAMLCWLITLFHFVGPVWVFAIGASMLLAAVSGRYMAKPVATDEIRSVETPVPTEPGTEVSLEMLRQALVQKQKVPTLKE